MSKVALADTGFWISLLDDVSDNDQHHRAETYFNLAAASGVTIYKPWPCLYEVFRARGVKSPRFRASPYLPQVLGSDHIIDDTDYRLSSIQYLSQQFGPDTHTDKNFSNLSKVDIVINKILEDRPNQIQYFITNNVKDFQPTLARLNRLEVIDLKIT